MNGLDAFSSFFDSQSSSTNSWNYDSPENFRQYTPFIQDHIKRVYLTLCCAIAASAVGAFFHVLLNIGGFLTTLACFGTMIWLLYIPPFEKLQQKREYLLMASALFQGASVGPLIDSAIVVDSSLILITFVATSLAFACFSAAALVAKHREHLYLGGVLYSGLSILMWLLFASFVFGGSTAIYKFELYFGLLVFVGLIVLDTKDIIESAHCGDLDYVKHALTLSLIWLRCLCGFSFYCREK